LIPVGRFLARAALPWALVIFGACVVAEALRYPTQAPAAPSLRLASVAAQARSPSASAPPQLVLQASGEVPAPPRVRGAHASALVAGTRGDDLLVFWWAGARESAPDVAIYAAHWADGRWGEARRILTREGLAAQLGFGVRRLGNPALWRAPDGRLHLWVVATGLGGWAAARVVHLVSVDDQDFRALRVLPLSPLLNTSVLVRTQPVGLSDGGWLLPAYFELGNKYPLLISFDALGTPRAVKRIGASTTSLQPAFTPISATTLRAWMRDHSKTGRLQRAISADAGQTWRDEPPGTIANHDSSVAAVRLREGGFVMVHNDQLPAPATPRQWLRLSTSADADRWTTALDVRRGAPGDEFSYPSVLQIGQQLHVTYTSQRRSIGHSVFNVVTPPGSGR
jgi:predicted neuraminidase